MMAFAAAAISFVVPFLVLLGAIVTIHELGHFLVAKWCGVKIDEFSIGFGRAILKRRDKAGVLWKIGWIPLGGYVRFAGDENEASVPDQDTLTDLRARIIAREGPGAERKYFPFKPLWQRTLVIAAGPIANFLLAIIIFAFLGGMFGVPVTDPVVGRVAPGTPAARAGFLAGDRILRANTLNVRTFDDLREYVVYRENVPIDFTVQRSGQIVHLRATPVRHLLDTNLNIEQYGGQLGIAPSGGHYERLGPLQAVGYGAERTATIVKTTVFVLGRMFTGQVAARDIVGGPLRMASMSHAVVEASAQAPTLPDQILTALVNLIQLAGLISVSLGFMNLLPIPVLDGGHLLFYAYEAVARRPLAARVQAAGYRVGLALLLCLMLFATWNDLQRLRVFQSLGGLFS